MLRIGITGGIGSGKTYVSDVFRALGVPVYSADKQARNLMETDSDLIKAILELFGESSYDDGRLNNTYIASLVFKEEKLLKKLNALVHPVVHEDFRIWSEHFHESAYVMEEAAILFESGGYKQMDYTVYVKSNLALRMERLKERDGLSEEEINRRMASQWPEKKKEAMADFIISNENDSMILPQIVDLHKTLLKH